MVGCYFNPEYTAENIIDQLSEGLCKIDTHDSVIVAGDMNCRIDRDYTKRINAINVLQQEGFTLKNKPKAYALIEITDAGKDEEKVRLHVIIVCTFHVIVEILLAGLLAIGIERCFLPPKCLLCSTLFEEMLGERKST
jgi:hypothetical protein